MYASVWLPTGTLFPIRNRSFRVFTKNSSTSWISYVKLKKNNMIDITSQKGFDALCRECEKQPYLAIDTEFIRERSFFPQLALLQIAWPGSAPMLIDPLKIDNWKPLHKILLNPNMTKIFHAGRQDIEIFFLQMGTIPTNLFDTQIAASFMGYGEQIGYGGLVQRMLGVELQKGDSYTNWLKRPLTESQIAYARNDVLYLIEIYEKLVNRAKALGRRQWIQEEIDHTFDNELFTPNPKNMWQRVKKNQSLKGRKLAVLQELAIWRYETAKAINKPLRFVLRDEVLISIAHRKQLDTASLSQIRGFQPKLRKQQAANLIHAFEKGYFKPKEDWPKRSERPSGYSSEIELIAELVWILVKEVSAKEGVAATLLLSKKQLPGYVSDFLRGQQTEFLTGWRKELIGSKLEALLNGKMSLFIDNGHVVFRSS
ncbi:MAG: ribonuclease D [Acidobacteria bacterium]|nr:MAG: ribonuclease D [Acidobacteriota bacterium]